MQLKPDHPEERKNNIGYEKNGISNSEDGYGPKRIRIKINRQVGEQKGCGSHII